MDKEEKDKSLFSDLHHITVVVEDIDQAISFYESLGIGPFKTHPNYEKINVTEAAYLLGVADLIGELRRYILEKLVEGEIDEARKYYETMKELYATFMQVECGKNLVSDFRRKKDVARILVERTLSDLFVAVQGKKLEERLGKYLDD